MKVEYRWAVALASENAIDLKMACALFEIGEPNIGEIKVSGARTETALFSDQFEGMSDMTPRKWRKHLPRLFPVSTPETN